MIKLLKQGKNKSEGSPGSLDQLAVPIYSPIQTNDDMNTWQHPYYMRYHPRPITFLGPKVPRNDTACDTDFIIYYLYISNCNWSL